MNKRLIIGLSSAFLVSQMALAQVSKTPIAPVKSTGVGTVSKSAFVDMTEPGRVRVQAKPSLYSSRSVDNSGRFTPYTITSESTGQRVGLELSLGSARNEDTQPQFEFSINTYYDSMTAKDSAVISGQSVSGTRNMKGFNDINISSLAALPVSSQVNLIGALGAGLSPETSKSKGTSNSSTQEYNAASGGHSLLTGLGIEVNPTKAPLSFGVLGKGTFTGDRKHETTEDGELDRTSIRRGGNELTAEVFTEMKIKKSRAGIALGMTEFGETTSESKEEKTGRMSYSSSIPRRYNTGKLYGHIVASENFVFKPSFTYNELNDPKHHGLDFDQNTMVELGAAVSF